MPGAKPLTISRDDLKRLDDSAWRLYADVVHRRDSTDADRRLAFDAAMHSLIMLLDHDARAFQSARRDYERSRPDD